METCLCLRLTTTPHVSEMDWENEEKGLGVGACVAIPPAAGAGGGPRRLGVIAVDNEDGTVDVILDDGTDLDGVWRTAIDVPTPEELAVAAEAEKEKTSQHLAKEDGALRFVCISDTHGLHRKIESLPDGDVLLHAGDFTNTGEQEQVQDVHDWMAEQSHRYKIVIAGNHDVTMDTKYYKSVGAKRFHGSVVRYDPVAVRNILVRSEHVVYLEDQGFEIPIPQPARSRHTLKVWGTPHQPEFCDWAFNLARGPATEEQAKSVPTDTDILLTHGPPLGFGDRCQDNFRAGCEHMKGEIQNRIKPAVHCFGHVHEGYGVSTDGVTSYVNASTCTYRYQPTNPPIVFDLKVGEDGEVGKPRFIHGL